MQAVTFPGLALWQRGAEVLEWVVKMKINFMFMQMKFVSLLILVISSERPWLPLKRSVLHAHGFDFAFH